MGGSSPLYLAIDQGGHASRAIVFDQHGRTVSTASAAIDTMRLGDDRVEHDPDALIDSIVQATQKALANLEDRAQEFKNVGFATQRSSIVCWDRITGAALSPVISWQDRRAARWLEQFADHSEKIHELTGLVLSPHYGASKFRWCLDYIPAVNRARVDERLCCGPLASFILFRLLRERPFVVDPANASRTLLWDFTRRTWAPALLELFGVPAQVMPPCVPSRFAYGHFDVSSHALPVEVCTGDQSAALFAFGEPRPDTVYINAGTGAFLQRIVGGRPLASTRLLSSVVWQSGNETVYVLEGTVNGAGSALGQVAGELGSKPEELDQVIPRALETVKEPPLFLNGVSGLGSPYWRADFQSRFVGEGTIDEKLAAVAESIVFLIQANLDELARCTEASRRIVITGGLATVDGLCQRLADLSGLPVERPAVQEATACGLSFLLAGRPATWLENMHSVQFTPVSSVKLAARYGRWQQAMNDDCAEGQAG